MRVIIDGKAYDTITAEEVIALPDPGPGDDHRWELTSLYRTKQGTYFVAGHGGSLSRWAKRAPDGGLTDGEGLELLDEAEARALVEERASEHYERIFGAVEEG